jgi:ribosomal-protein-alanine N-acetyltransferase
MSAHPVTTHEAGGECTLCRMATHHLDQVLAIERSFAAPWTREMFLQELHSRPEVSEAIVALLQEEVAGYVLAWFVADEIHVVNLAVASRLRRRGIGRRLLAEVCARGVARGMVMATLEVRVHNDAAIRLYESMGFRQVAIRRSYYADNGEDALVMLKDLEPPRQPGPGGGAGGRGEGQ